MILKGADSNMSIDLATNKKLLESEDTTRTTGFEKASNNTIVLRQGYCPQCLSPMGMKNVQGKTSVKVYTSNGIDLWCETCFKTGEEKGICIKWRSMDKKERKAIRKMLKKKGKS